MKLLDRYNRISLFITILVIVVTGVVYYFTISYILTGQVDKDLEVEENEIFEYVKLNHKLPQVFKSDDLKIHFLSTSDTEIKRSFTDTHLYDEAEHENEAARMLTSSVKVGTQNYRIQIIESKVETEDLIRFIFLITLGIILILLTVLLLINRILVRKLWQPFYQTLKQIKLFNLADKNAISPIDTKIEEFHDLNQEITAMSLRVLKDYESLKSFVENASHELMTPLAVIVSKLDTLTQDENITHQQGALIGEVYDTVGRLKKLNRSMLLLSRIENKLLPEQESIDLREFVGDKLSEFQELLADKDIEVANNSSACHITMSRDLLNVMLNNLLGNAILHNKPQGEIIVLLTSDELSVCNSGAPSALNENVIFQRFHKSPESEGTGLGLTLVKEICESYGYTFSYTYRNDLHCFTVRF